MFLVEVAAQARSVMSFAADWRGWKGERSGVTRIPPDLEVQSVSTNREARWVSSVCFHSQSDPRSPAG